MATNKKTQSETVTRSYLNRRISSLRKELSTVRITINPDSFSEMNEIMKRLYNEAVQSRAASVDLNSIRPNLQPLNILAKKGK